MVNIAAARRALNSVDDTVAYFVLENFIKEVESKLSEKNKSVKVCALLRKMERNND